MSLKTEMVPTAYSTQSTVVFSSLVEKKLGVGLQWTPWRPKILVLQNDAVLIVKDNPSDEGKERYDLSTVKITHMNQSALDGNGSTKDVGILLEVKTPQGHETRIRIVMDQLQQTQFYESVRLVAREHNVDAIRQVSITDQVKISSKKKRRNPFGRQTSVSTMRSTIAMAMDQVDTRSKRERIVAKRGALKWLPVFFSNDMVHGSWWFVVASLLFVISSAIVLDNSYRQYLGDDDSFLSQYRYRATWVLMTISGVLFTIGSLVFVRAVHEDPPMKPLFTWYHVQSDELLGSWLFFFATLPVIPYALIYLAASHGSYLYFGALFAAVVVVFVTYLFVRACYPNDQPRMKIIQPLTNALCCCFCSQAWRKRHLANDWLAGCWIFLFATIFATILMFFATCYELYEADSLLVFIIVTSLIETICCLIAAAYWVAGSYPEMDEDEDDEDIPIEADATNPYSGTNFVHSSNSNDRSDNSYGAGPTAANSNGSSTNRQKSLLKWFFRGSEGNLSTPFIPHNDV